MSPAATERDSFAAGFSGGLRAAVRRLFKAGITLVSSSIRAMA
jgi:hypothetical protein